LATPSLTQRQIQKRKVVQTLYIPLPVAIQIDDEAKRLGISRSAVINRFIAQGLNNNKRKALQGLQNQGANQDATQAALVPAPITTTNTTTNTISQRLSLPQEVRPTE
jgi:hypothetical protein